MKIKRDFLLDPSLVLYLPLWKLDGAKFRSEDAYGHLATVSGASWILQGRDFDGVNDGINCGSPVSLDITKAITVAAWVKFDIVSGTDKYIAGKITPWSQGYLLSFFVPDAPSFRIVTTAGAGHPTPTAGLIAVGDWHFLVGTYDSYTGENAIWVDGQKAGTRQTSGTLVVSTNSFFIGQHPGGSNLVDGSIGEVFVYNRALTPLEIQSNYLATKWRYQG